MRIIITGAGSFLGKALVRALSEDAGAHELICFRHSFEEEPDRLPQRADAFVHLAWAGVGSAGRSDQAIQAYNVEMSMAALKKAAQLGCRSFLFSGSQAEYGISHSGLQREDMRCMPVSEYGRAKLLFGELAERWVHSLNEEERGRAGGNRSAAGESGSMRNGSEEEPLRLIHARIFSVYGPGDHDTSLISTGIKSCLADRALLLGSCTQDWDYLYIDDAARALLALILSEKAEGIYNIASGDIRPLKEYLASLRSVLGSGSELQFGMRENNAEGAASLRPSVGKIQELCGWRPEVSFEEGIRRTAKALQGVSKGA
ncbi:MAG: NAD(P)-dependent oxidoreductase [Eubacteriales bacterium]|nr:NAD(P)-dependent oxidoreductase [Eubacteriales bacterium]